MTEGATTDAATEPPTTATPPGRWAWPSDRRAGVIVGGLLLLAAALPPAWGWLDPRLQVLTVDPDAPGAFAGPDPWGRPWELVHALPLPDAPVEGLPPAVTDRAVRPATHWPREVTCAGALADRVREPPGQYSHLPGEQGAQPDPRWTRGSAALTPFGAPPRAGATPISCFVYSRGPDGVDDTGRGDDCVIDWVRTPTEIFWLGSRAVLVLLAGLVVAAHAAARLATGPRRGVKAEVARSVGAALALTLLVAGLVLAAFWADDWLAGRALRKVTDAVDDLGGARPLGLPPAAALLGSFLGASALAVLFARTRGRGVEVAPEGRAGEDGAPAPGLR